MKYLSVCSGIEAASVAFEPLGWKPLAFSEIEPFPRAVLRHHYPDTPCHGDFTTLKDEPWIVDADMLCGGTPCQAFSVAGNRRSLADDRGNLTLQFVLLANAIDARRTALGREPAWILWENVPGVLSTRDNAFGSFLAGLAGEDAPIEPGPRPAEGKSSAYWSWKAKNGIHAPKWPQCGVVDGPQRTVAWRVLDAQYFGLAQRRKRVFVLALGGPRRWAVADALLPIIEGGECHPAPSRSKGEGVAATITSGAANGGPAHGARSGSAKEGNLIPEVTRPLTAAMGTKWNGNGDLESSLIPSIVGTLTANMVGCAGTPGYNETEHILPLVPYRVHGEHSTAMRGNGAARVADPAEVARCLDTCGGYSTNQGGNVVLTTHEVVGSLCAESGPNTHGSRGVSGTQTMLQGYIQPTLNMQVRRLTPVECERLQGFPDGWTAIPWRGKPAEECPDGNRYKALGNSWAVPCARYIGERIQAVTCTPHEQTP